ncbi:MAG: adenosylcobinamide amidohydrolase [Acidimicrobiia bacterium]
MADVEPERLVHPDGGDGTARPVLVWRAAEPFLCASSGVLGGGLGLRSWVLNAQVALRYHHEDPAAHVASIADELGLEPAAGTGLLTAARVLEVVVASDGGAGCAATVGISVPTWAAAPDGELARWAPGTINLVCTVPGALSDAALVNAVATATEAKSQALAEVGVDGTGTASDAVVVCCPPGGEEAYGGPRSRWGARLARAVHAAVARGARDWLAGR